MYETYCTSLDYIEEVIDYRTQFIFGHTGEPSAAHLILALPDHHIRTATTTISVARASFPGRVGTRLLQLQLLTTDPSAGHAGYYFGSGYWSRMHC